MSERAATNVSTVHVINHTHWDREWFLTHEYTTAWIPELIDSLVELTAVSDNYQFLFDGQTLVIEDLLRTRPEYRATVQGLLKTTALTIGPVYSQPDWRMVSGELHVRNLQYGVGDAEALGGQPDVAWLVDTFGHISQAPQLLSQIGVDAAFVWRGVPKMTPLFVWEGADGTRLPTIDLFSGYRNLYGVTKTPGIAVDRLVAEVDKLAPVYRGLPIPLFDGYDLDTEPEDPASYYRQLEVPDTIDLEASSPRAYVDAVLTHLDGAPTITGELLSGKFGSTFPGSLSSRTYLKVLHHDAEIALHRRVEPLATLAASVGAPYQADRFERASRELLQNGVHDCICGVSIDQVHERMERSYRRLLSWSAQQEAASAATLLGGFETGTYALSTVPIPSDRTYRIGAEAFGVTTKGVGVTPVHARRSCGEPTPISSSFTWTNDHFSAEVSRDGLSVDGRPGQARIVVRADSGDTYSSEPGEILGELAIIGTPLCSTSDLDAEVSYRASLEVDSTVVKADVAVRFDHTPIISIDIVLDSAGTGFRADAVFDSGIRSDSVSASMPFDVVERPHRDDDLLPHDIPDDLRAILMGQRETGTVDEFPVHDFLAISDPATAWAVLGTGNRSCSSTPEGTLSIGLRRSAEWLALTGLTGRSGDAGPAMYVPGARCEREVTHRLALAVLPGKNALSHLLPLSEAFHNPALIAEVEGAGHETEWTAFAEALPMTSLAVEDGTPTARFYNPYDAEHELEQERPRRSLRGADLGIAAHLEPKEIATLGMSFDPPPEPKNATVTILNPTIDRVGPSRSKPDAHELNALAERISELEQKLVANRADRVTATGADAYRLEHVEYVLDRERLELELSLELNRRLQSSTDEVSIPDDADPEIADLGWRLNELRVKRRIFDYVVQGLAG